MAKNVTCEPLLYKLNKKLEQTIKDCMQVITNIPVRFNFDRGIVHTYEISNWT